MCSFGWAYFFHTRTVIKNKIRITSRYVGSSSLSALRVARAEASTMPSCCTRGPVNLLIVSSVKCASTFISKNKLNSHMKSKRHKSKPLSLYPYSVMLET